MNKGSVESRSGQDGRAQAQTPITAVAAAAAVEVALKRYRKPIAEALREALTLARNATPPSAANAAFVDELYGQIEFHLGWRAQDFTPLQSHPGKLLRPSLTLFACEVAAISVGATGQAVKQAVRRALPGAAAVELVHNFSLTHDDIEDGDEERRHRPTMWKLWGVPQAINSGDALYSLARLPLWTLVERGVAPALVVRLADGLDRTCLELCEGQHLDMTFEGRREVSVAMYLDMITRKTAALMRYAAELGGRIGAPDDTTIGARLGAFGGALGLAFQLRDDLLGVWAAEDLGKTAAGDVRRKKMSLPVIHALEHASAADARTLNAIYAAPGPASDEQIAQALTIFAHTSARQRVQ
ncbi:MAG: polyprenyl synthetase family protein, partial [Ktedonobacterales bacterium]